MRVLMIGGKGFVGARAVAAMRRAKGAEVVVGSRSASGQGEVRVDLADPSTFAAMRGFDFVVNLSDTTQVAPDEAAAYCLSEGPTFLETTTEAAVHDRLHQRFRAGGARHKGGLVLGVGLFPGLSNLVAAALAHAVPDCQRLEVGVRLNPMSGAGEGMCGVMARMLVAPAPQYEAGQRIDDVSMRAGIPMPFDDGRHPTIKNGLPEGALLHWSTRVPSTAAYLSTTVPFPAPMVSFMTWMLSRGEGVRQTVQGMMKAQFRMLRARMLRDKPTPVSITAVANRSGPATGAEPSLCLKVNDGVLATGYAVAAMLQVLGTRERTPGCHMPDELMRLSEVVEAMRTLAGGELELSGPWSPTQTALPAGARQGGGATT